MGNNAYDVPQREQGMFSCMVCGAIHAGKPNLLKRYDESIKRHIIRLRFLWFGVGFLSATIVGVFF